MQTPRTHWVPHGQCSPHCHQPLLVAVPRLSGTFARVVTAGGCWHFLPSLLLEEVHPGWNGNHPVTCWGRGQAGDSCPPALHSSSHSAFGDTGGAATPTLLLHSTSGLGLGQPLGLAVPGGKGCSRCLLLLPQDPPLNKIISAPLLVCVAAGWAQDVAPLAWDPQPDPGRRFRNKESLLWL